MKDKILIVRSVAWTVLVLSIATIALSWNEQFVALLTAKKAEHYGAAMASCFRATPSRTQFYHWDKDKVEQTVQRGGFLEQGSMRDVRVNPYVDSVAWGYDADDTLHIFVHRRASDRAPVDTVLEDDLGVRVAPRLSHRFDGPAGYIHYATDYTPRRVPLPNGPEAIQRYLEGEGSPIAVYATYAPTKKVVLTWSTNYLVSVFNSARREIRRNSCVAMAMPLIILAVDAVFLLLVVLGMRRRRTIRQLATLYWRGETASSLRRLDVNQSHRESLAQVAELAAASREQTYRRNLRDKVADLVAFLDANAVIELIAAGKMREAERVIVLAEEARAKKRREDHLLIEAEKVGQSVRQLMAELLKSEERQVTPDQLLQNARQCAGLRCRYNLLEQVFQEDLGVQLDELNKLANKPKFAAFARRFSHELEAAERKQDAYNQRKQAAARRARA